MCKKVVEKVFYTGVAAISLTAGVVKKGAVKVGKVAKKGGGKISAGVKNISEKIQSKKKIKPSFDERVDRAVEESLKKMKLAKASTVTLLKKKINDLEEQISVQNQA